MNILENTLDWIADGVALLRADDRIAYGNDMLHELARHGDGLRIVGDSMRLRSWKPVGDLRLHLARLSGLAMDHTRRNRWISQPRVRAACRPISSRCVRL